MGTRRDIGHPEGPGNKWARDFGPFLTLGLQLAITVVIFFLLGRWLDGKFGTSPWGMLVGLAIGIVGGFIRFFRTAIEMGNKSDAEGKKDETEG